jgi:hypothetical protein
MYCKENPLLIDRNSFAFVMFTLISLNFCTSECDVQYYLQDFVAQNDESFEDMYKMAQQPGRVLPRLYLMVTTACCAIKAEPKQVSFYLNDLLEVCKGIQNPMRGLFLRSFLSSSVRTLLPDTSSMLHNVCF